MVVVYHDIEYDKIKEFFDRYYKYREINNLPWDDLMNEMNRQKDVGKSFNVSTYDGFDRMPKTLHNIKNITHFDKSVHDIHEKIIKTLQSCTGKQIQLTENEFSIYEAKYYINNVRIRAELINSCNSILFLKKDLTPYNQIKLWQITKKLDYSDKEYYQLKNLFFINLRNALSHTNHNYKFDIKSGFKLLIWWNGDKSYEYTMDDLRSVMKKMNLLLDIHVHIFERYYPDI